MYKPKVSLVHILFLLFFFLAREEHLALAERAVVSNMELCVNGAITTYWPYHQRLSTFGGLAY